MIALGRPAEILLVEDNPSDARLTRVALGRSAFASHLVVSPDGDEALAILRREGAHAEGPRPDLVLLDLNLPGTDGRIVLREIKADDRLRCIPVVVLTSSTAAADVRECYDLHANCYVVKPMDFDEFERAVRTIEEFWLGVVMPCMDD